MDPATVQSNIRELEALRAQTRYWRWGISVVLLVTVVTCLVSLRNAMNGLASEGATREAFVQDLSQRMQKDAVPTIEQMGTQALHEINFQAEVQKLNKRTPELAKASLAEVKTFGDDLPARGKKVLDATFGAAIKQHQAKLQAEFPEATPDQLTALMNNLAAEALTQAESVNTELFAEHRKAIDSIMKDFANIQSAGAAEAKGQQPTWDMALLVFDLARTDLKALDATDSAPAKGAKSAKGAAK